MKKETARIPSSTYRLQFHAGFTFRDGLEILDYLQDMGITDVYASPIFQAGPESTHGYDVANHNRINPSLGTEKDFRAFAAALRQRDMGLVLDFVPNHMGISESLNRWWMETLEDGESSQYARFFDIDWHPRKKALAGKVLLPILGQPYGAALEAGELSICFEKGAFFCRYYETRLPLCCDSCSLLLEPVLPSLEPALVLCH